MYRLDKRKKWLKDVILNWVNRLFLSLSIFCTFVFVIFYHVRQFARETIYKKNDIVTSGGFLSFWFLQPQIDRATVLEDRNVSGVLVHKISKQTELTCDVFHKACCTSSPPQPRFTNNIIDHLLSFDVYIFSTGNGPFEPRKQEAVDFFCVEKPSNKGYTEFLLFILLTTSATLCW